MLRDILQNGYHADVPVRKSRDMGPLHPPLRLLHTNSLGVFLCNGRPRPGLIISIYVMTTERITPEFFNAMTDPSITHKQMVLMFRSVSLDAQWIA